MILDHLLLLSCIYSIASGQGKSVGILINMFIFNQLINFTNIVQCGYILCLYLKNSIYIFLDLYPFNSLR